jgi:hypothetical protein
MHFRRYKAFPFHTLLALCGLLCAFQARAQQDEKTPEPPPGNVLKQIVPRVTGHNGYEELIYAGELARSSLLLREIQEKPSFGTLTEKRAALADRPVVQALALLRAGLSKPVVGPRNPNDMDENIALPEYALFRNLARLLHIEMYVRLADGNVSGALDSLRDGLRLGYSIQSETLIAGLVGVAIDAIVVQRIAQHLAQFSERDCERLLALVKEWLNAPSPLEQVMAAEQSSMVHILNKKRGNLQGLIELITGAGAGDDDTGNPQLTALDRFIRANPTGLNDLLDQTIARLNAYHTLVRENIRRPAWERKELPPQNDNTPAGELFAALTPSVHQVLDRYDSERAMMHLLGVQAALHKYRWHFGKWPDTLDALRIGALALDPLTGKKLLYTRQGDTYELSSAGPFQRDADGKPTGRKPVLLPRPRDP